MSEKGVAVPRNFRILVFGAAAAPVFWLGQLILGYGVSASACYGGDHPTTVTSGAPLLAALVVFDGVAILMALAGLFVSTISFSASEKGSRSYFLAVWGIFSSLWFLGAIVFSTIASVTVPLCVR